MMDQTIEKELIKLENKYWQAIKDGDTETAMELTDDPCIVAGANGAFQVDKKSFVKMMEQPKYTLNNFKIKDDVKVRVLTDDVAILAYTVHEDLTVDGKPVSLDASESSTWVHRNGSWVCALHTESVLGDPYARDRKQVSNF